MATKAYDRFHDADGLAAVARAIRTATAGAIPANAHQSTNQSSCYRAQAAEVRREAAGAGGAVPAEESKKKKMKQKKRRRPEETIASGDDDGINGAPVCSPDTQDKRGKQGKRKMRSTLGSESKAKKLAKLADEEAKMDEAMVPGMLLAHKATTPIVAGVDQVAKDSPGDWEVGKEQHDSESEDRLTEEPRNGDQPDAACETGVQGTGSKKRRVKRRLNKGCAESWREEKASQPAMAVQEKEMSFRDAYVKMFSTAFGEELSTLYAADSQGERRVGADVVRFYIEGWADSLPDSFKRLTVESIKGPAKMASCEPCVESRLPFEKSFGWL
eukprot:evm.model.scf_16.6 EVM.evm.TU.scf_16.6   scf_16:76992-81869(-)